ncbi:hypothetical protein EDB84DRAFT_1445534 [Lactarius hengduanensis]|nr:hypothetical protein EDB84DRAFT_1445534 [Lactarius hengduanensis]
MSPSSISRTHGGGWLMVSGVPVSRANELLASYQLYWHAGTNVNFPHDHRSDDTLRLHGGGASGELKDVLSCRDVRVTPVFLRVLSGTVKYEPAATDRNVLGVTGYLGQYPPESLDQGFMKRYCSDGIDTSLKRSPGAEIANYYCTQHLSTDL